MTRSVHRALISAVLAVAALTGTGCEMFNRSSLATDSGPTITGGEWSVAGEQWVHVGEKVDFSCLLATGYADYAVLEIPQLGIAKVCTQPDRSRFYFDNLTFQEPTPLKKPLTVKVTCYRERGERDYMDADGKLLIRESPDDPSDAKVSSAQIKLHVYQAVVKVDVPANAAGYTWETGKLQLYGQSDQPDEVHMDCPYRKGFHVDGPNAAGAFLVTYEPTADQVKRTGTTRVVLTVLDGKGRQYRQEMALPTP